MRILLQSGTIINEGRIFKGDLLIHNDRIEKIIEGKLIPDSNRWLKRNLKT